jgi:hypothetical protein
MVKQDDRKDHWVVVEPGVLKLPTTRYQIRYVKRLGRFTAWHDGRKLRGESTLETMKWVVDQHMKDLLETGIEP